MINLIYVPCRACDGKGRRDTKCFGMQPCRACNARGVQLVPDNGLLECHGCSGSGMFYTFFQGETRHDEDCFPIPYDGICPVCRGAGLAAPLRFRDSQVFDFLVLVAGMVLLPLAIVILIVLKWP